ncbi:MAG TPA: hypothetical protein VGD41_18340, partial [Pyrinomonadaceae bacterium]
SNSRNSNPDVNRNGNRDCDVNGITCPDPDSDSNGYVNGNTCHKSNSDTECAGSSASAQPVDAYVDFDR